MRLIVALSAVAMIGLSSAMNSAAAASQDSSINQTLSPKPAAGESVVARGGRAGGVFGRIMEIERRKNAWLRGVFS
ncbi:MAG: hypothetical protein R3C17_04295 [Planctomycetaceae bacterium]